MRELKSTVFIVDDDVQVLKDLRALMQSVQLPVETFAGVGPVLGCFDGSRPGCLILDVRMSEMSGIELCRRLRHAGTSLPVIFVTAHGDVPTAVQAMQEGAFDFLQRPFSEQYLLDRVHAALEKDRKDRRRMAERREAAARFAGLSAKERQVVELIVNGKTSKAMAGELGIGLKTVDFHRANIMRKVGAETVGELVCLLFKGGYGGPMGDRKGRGGSLDAPGASRGVPGRPASERRAGVRFLVHGPGDTTALGIRVAASVRRRTKSAAPAGVGTPR